MKAAFDSILGKYGPPAFLAVLLTVIGFGIQRKSAVTNIPPTHDSFHYYLKSKGVWEQLKQGAFMNTLNVAEPLMRPPGGVLVSYPFGFSRDYRGFFFRNAFVPIVIFVFSLCLLALEFSSPGRQRWMAAALIGGFASFSMFYHFTFNPEIDGRWRFYHPWGMQDCLLASLGTLAAVLLILSARRRSLVLSIAGAFVGSWLLMVKPAGALLMVLVFWLWLTELVISSWPILHRWKTDRCFRKYVISAGMIICLLFSATVFLSIHSRYLSAETRSLFSSGLKLVLDFTHPMSFKLLNQMVMPSIGWHWFVFLTVSLAVLVSGHGIRAVRRQWLPEDWRLPGVVLGFGGGLYWWVMTAAQQIRYLFPFLLILVAGILPDLLRFTARLKPWACRTLGLCCLAPAFLVSGVVLAKHAPYSLQRAIGVSVTTDGLKEDAAIAQIVMKDARTRQALTRGYLLADDASFAVIHSMTELERSLEPDKPFVAWYASWDWQRGFLVSRTDLLNSSYILFRPCSSDVQTVLRQEDLTAWEEEANFFKVWLRQLSDNDGIRQVMSGKLCLLEIVDQLKFNSAFEKMMAGRRWRPIFISENSLRPASAPAQKFGASQKTLFHASPRQNASALRSNTGLDVADKGDHLELKVSGSEARLDLPEMEVPPGCNLLVRVCGDSPVLSQMKVATNGNPAVVQALCIGANELYFLLPGEAGPARVTVNPSLWGGLFLLREIEVRAVPKD